MESLCEMMNLHCARFQSENMIGLRSSGRQSTVSRHILISIDSWWLLQCRGRHATTRWSSWKLTCFQTCFDQLLSGWRWISKTSCSIRIFGIEKWKFMEDISGSHLNPRYLWKYLKTFDGWWLKVKATVSGGLEILSAITGLCRIIDYQIESDWTDKWSWEMCLIINEIHSARIISRCHTPFLGWIFINIIWINIS